MTRPGAPTRFADPVSVHPAFPAGTGGVVVAAPAKLNLFLEILRKRPDGYHDLESLMVAVDLFDTLELRAISPRGLSPAKPGFTAAPATGQISLTCDPPTLSAGPDNLVYKAAVALRTHVNRPELGAEILLTKRVPTQAGLGGGSSDSAAALVGLNRIWKLGLTREELLAIAASIGSDVAFFLTLPAAWCEGRGERVSPELGAAVKPGFAGDRPRGQQAGGLDFVLVCPPVGLGTAGVYKRLAVPNTPTSGDAVRAAYRAGDADALGRALFNRLEEPAFALEPLVGRVRKRLAALGPCGAMMSGSGSAVFAVCRDRAHAAEVAERFRNTRPADEPESRVLVVRSLIP